MWKILVPLDFSACSMNALHYAVELGKATQSELVLFHAYHPPFGQHDNFYVNEQIIQREEQKAKTKMRSIVASNPELNQLTCCLLVKMALAEDGMAEAVHTHHIDLIVMGTKGASGTSNEWLGSNTCAIIKKAVCPVIAVPEHYKQVQWKQIVFATNLHMIHEDHAISVLISLVKTLQSRLQVMHVYHHPASLSKSEVDEVLKLNHRLHEVPHTIQWIKEDDVYQGIQHYLEKHPTDLLAVMPEQHPWFAHLFKGSITRDLTLHTQIPLLAIF